MVDRSSLFHAYGKLSFLVINWSRLMIHTKSDPMPHSILDRLNGKCETWIILWVAILLGLGIDLGIRLEYGVVFQVFGYPVWNDS